MLKLARQGALSKSWRRQRQGPTCRREQVNNWLRSETGLNRAKTGLGWSVVPSSVHDARWPRCSSINCLFLHWPPHPSIHQKAAGTKEKHREEADSRRKSSSCLGDDLGHALAAMVGPTWWSHGGVLEPQLEFVKSFVPSIFDGDVIISCPTLIYIDECFINMCS
jgi:hypothetical protein